MKQRTLGSSGLVVSALGLGCMSMSSVYGKADEAESVATIEQAHDLGATFLDTADVYGDGHNEQLVGKAVRGFRGEMIIATKFGNARDKDGKHYIDGRPEYVKQACDASLRRLGMDVIDLYYQHRVDPAIPIEETAGAMADLVRVGKVRHLGLSEAAPATIRRAHRVHPIAALQTEYSLWTRDCEHEVLATCRELKIGFVAYSPLGRGFLAGAVRTVDDLAADDRRRVHPRFSPDNVERNLRLVDRMREMAQAKGCTLPQLVLAWVLAQGSDIVPIPGAKRRAHLEENLRALEVELTPADLAAIDEIAPHGVAAGARYPEGAMKAVNR